MNLYYTHLYENKAARVFVAAFFSLWAQLDILETPVRDHHLCPISGGKHWALR